MRLKYPYDYIKYKTRFTEKESYKYDCPNVTSFTEKQYLIIKSRIFVTRYHVCFQDNQVKYGDLIFMCIYCSFIILVKQSYFSATIDICVKWKIFSSVFAYFKST